jgi:hypothetical protein
LKRKKSNDNEQITPQVGEGTQRYRLIKEKRWEHVTRPQKEIARTNALGNNGRKRKRKRKRKASKRN